MKARIRQRALELGFDDCRFTTAASPASAEQLTDWLADRATAGRQPPTGFPRNNKFVG